MSQIPFTAEQEAKDAAQDATAVANASTAATAAATAQTAVDLVDAGQFDVTNSTETSSGTSGAISVSVLRTNIDSTAGAGSRTLAAPAADGKLKIINMTVDNGDTTLAGTNIWGQTAATGTFDAVGDNLVLFSVGGKWHVVANAGVTFA